MLDRIAPLLPATFGVAGLLYLWLAARVKASSGDTANHAIALFLFLVGALVLGSALAYGTMDTALYSLGRVLSFAGSGFIPVAVYYVYREYTLGPPTRLTLAALGLVPTATTLIAITNPWHQLLWSVEQIPDGVQFSNAAQHDWFRYVHAPFAYVLFTYSIVALIGRLRDVPAAHRRYVVLFVLAAVLPLAVSFGNIYLGLGPFDFPFTSLTLTLLLPFYWYLGLGLRVYDFGPLNYHTLLDHLHDPIIVLNKSQRILAVNRPAQVLLDKPEKALIGRHLWNDVPAARVLREHVAATDLSQTVRMRRDQYFEIYTSRMIGANGNDEGSLLVCRDVTKRKLAQKALADSEHLIRSLVENSSNGILRFALDNEDESEVNEEIGRFRCTFANKAAEKFLRAGGGTLVGMPLDKIEVLEPARLIDRFMGNRSSSTPLNYETSVDLDDSERWLRVVGEPVGNDISVTLIDITQRKHNENRILRDSLRDPLTGALNRRGFEKEGVDRIRGARCGAVLYLDLNQFKTINDRFGHPAGDALLKAFGHRLEYCLRPEDILARLGGDEFAIILPGVDLDDVKHVAARLIETGSEPYIIQGQEISCTASVGIALIPQHGEELWQLVSIADRAMYNVKSMSTSASADWAAYVDAAIAV